jgi:hypothetical protein
MNRRTIHAQNRSAALKPPAAAARNLVQQLVNTGHLCAYLVDVQAYDALQKRVYASIA